MFKMIVYRRISSVLGIIVTFHLVIQSNEIAAEYLNVSFSIMNNV